MSLLLFLRLTILTNIKLIKWNYSLNLIVFNKLFLVSRDKAESGDLKELQVGGTKTLI